MSAMKSKKSYSFDNEGNILNNNNSLVSVTTYVI